LGENIKNTNVVKKYWVTGPLVIDKHD